jgi:hypothetical protein
LCFILYLLLYHFDLLHAVPSYLSYCMLYRPSVVISSKRIRQLILIVVAISRRRGTVRVGGVLYHQLRYVCVCDCTACFDNAAVQFVSGGYGPPVLGPLRDHEFFRRRAVFCVNIPPTFPFFVGVDPRVVDAAALAALFDRPSSTSVTCWPGPTAPARTSPAARHNPP